MARNSNHGLTLIGLSGIGPTILTVRRRARDIFVYQHKSRFSIGVITWRVRNLYWCPTTWLFLVITYVFANTELGSYVFCHIDRLLLKYLQRLQTRWPSI